MEHISLFAFNVSGCNIACIPLHTHTRAHARTHARARARAY